MVLAQATSGQRAFAIGFEQRSAPPADSVCRRPLCRSYSRAAFARPLSPLCLGITHLIDHPLAWQVFLSATLSATFNLPARILELKLYAQR
jgi:hypothetical protein